MASNEVFKIQGSILLKDDEFIKGLKNALGEAEKGSSKMSNFFSKMGKGAVAVGKTVATGLAVAGAGVTALVTKSIQSYADYEQLVGGVDTLFKKSSDKVQEYAKNAYKTAGLSANDYMETVTSFSASLLQSLDGDTSKAADKANMAITDMSDNANKMGTSMEMIQNAYQGFAKQNYTMLDNLKLGYGGTKEEMQRLLEDAEKISGIEYDISSYADIVDAIHVIQNEMGITGTTAKEASQTISGSINAMKGSWQNLLTAIADDNAPFEEYMSSFVNSVSDVAKNLLPRIKVALNGVVQLVQQLAPMIIREIPGLVSTLLPSIVNASTSIVKAIADTLPSLITAIVACIPDFINAFVSIFDAIVSALPSLIQAIVSALPTLIPALINGLVIMIVTLCTMLPEIIQPIIDYLPAIIISIVNALLQNLPVLIEGLIQLTLGIVGALPQIIQTLVDALPQIISMIITGLLNNVPALITGLIQVVAGIVTALPQIFSSLVDGVVNIFKGIWNGIKNVFSGVGEWFGKIWDSIGKGNPAIENIKKHIENVFNAIKNYITTVFTSIKNVVSTVWNSIKNVISTVLNSIKNVFSTIWNSIKNVVTTIINSIKTVISTVWNAIKTIIANVMNIIFSVIKGDWSSVRDSIKNILNAIKSVISSVWNAIKNVIKSVMEGIKNTIKSIWDGIKNTIKSVINGIKNTVSSVFNGIKNIAKSAWNGVKLAMTKPIESARDKIKSIVDKVKGFFKGVKLQFPNVKLPHFSIKPSGWKIGDLLKGSIPKLGIDWYAKAMDHGFIMDKPTAFGVNANGQLMAGGEKGSETIVGTNSLLNMIQSSVASQNAELTSKMDNILNILSMYLPQLIERQLVMDTGEVVGALTYQLDRSLGDLSEKRGRGR